MNETSATSGTSFTPSTLSRIVEGARIDNSEIRSIPVTEYLSFFKDAPYISSFLMIDFLQTMTMTSVRQLLLFIVAITIGTALPAAAQHDSTQDLKAAAASQPSSPRMRFLSSFCPDSK
jgi:hypothetical protein